MTTVLKFRNFDEDNDDARAPGAETGFYTREEVDALIKKSHEQGRITGYLAGVDAGRAEVRQSFETAQAETAEALAQELAHLANTAEDHREALVAQVVGFTLQTCEVVFPELIERLSAARVKKMVSQSLKMAIGSSRIQVRLSPATLSELEADLRSRAAYYKCDHALDLQADVAMRDGEARMEWNHGSLDYGFEKICNRLLTELRNTHEKATNSRKETLENGKP